LSDAPHTATPTATRPRGAVAGLERVGKTRDGILLIGGALYVLGYVVWSVHALNEGLGLLPALELQYLLAGSLLAGILFAALLLGVALTLVAFASERWERSPHRSIQLAAGALPFVIGGASVVITWTLLILAGHIAFAFLFPLVAFLVVIPLVSTVESLKRYVDRNERQAAVALTGGLIAVSAAVYFVTSLYPKVPQELGGVKPRCGYVEVDRADTSPLLARELFAGAQTKRGIIVRSHKLLIFFSGGETYVVRLQSGRKANTYELRKDIVKSVSDC
jgi:hypothetical protein